MQKGEDVIRSCAATGVDGFVKLVENLVEHPSRIAVVFATPELLRSDFSVSLIGLRMQGVKAPFALLHADDFYVPHGELTAPQMVDTALAMLLPERRVTCAICMDDISTEDANCTLPCSHSYHNACINRWLGEKSGCPVCRSRIAKEVVVV